MFFQNSQCFHPIFGCFGGNRGFTGKMLLNFFAEVGLILILKIVFLYEVDSLFSVQTKEEDNCKLYMK